MPCGFQACVGGRECGLAAVRVDSMDASVTNNRPASVPVLRRCEALHASRSCRRHCQRGGRCVSVVGNGGKWRGLGASCQPRTCMLAARARDRATVPTRGSDANARYWQMDFASTQLSPARSYDAPQAGPTRVPASSHRAVARETSVHHALPSHPRRACVLCCWLVRVVTRAMREPLCALYERRRFGGATRPHPISNGLGMTAILGVLDEAPVPSSGATKSSV